MFKLPRTPVEELNEKREYPTVEPGDYHLKIVEVACQTSQQGNPMVMLKLEGINAKVTLFDYMVNDEKMAWKWHHLFIAIGDEDMYTRGEFDPRFLNGKIVRAKLIVKQSDKHGKQNKVKDYLKPEKITFETESTLESAAFDDSIPF